MSGSGRTNETRNVAVGEAAATLQYQEAKYLYEQYNHTKRQLDPIISTNQRKDDKVCRNIVSAEN